MPMTAEEVKAKSKNMYEHVDDLNTMAEARQAVRDALSMVFGLADDSIRQQAEIKSLKAEIEALKGSKGEA